VTSDYSPLQELPRLAGTVDRRQLVEAAARDRRVLHLGCVDDRLTVERFERGELLHAQLAAVARSLVGVDINRDGIALLEDRLPGSYLVGDVERLDELELPSDTELVVASELIEHLANPGRFLAQLREYLRRTDARAIITTPNAYGWVGFVKMAARRREPTHPDHVLVYSPYTLDAALRAAGLHVEQLWMHDWARGGGVADRLRDAATTLVRRWNPYLAVGLVAEVRALP
jgi:SAM-dependent methyltransferase